MFHDHFRISGRSFGPNFGFPYTFCTFSLLPQLKRGRSASWWPPGSTLIWYSVRLTTDKYLFYDPAIQRMVERAYSVTLSIPLSPPMSGISNLRLSFQAGASVFFGRISSFFFPYFSMKTNKLSIMSTDNNDDDLVLYVSVQELYSHQQNSMSSRIQRQDLMIQSQKR